MEMIMIRRIDLQLGDYCLVSNEEALWPGKVTQVTLSDVVRIKCLEKAKVPGSTWRWPKRIDEQEYCIADVKQKIEIPEYVPGSIHNLVVHAPELDHIWG